ncbi:MAG: response regulator transcription factor [Acidobacteria bacterium]|nr:response regulator transcription factor [Acidobacteriota bacterium]
MKILVVEDEASIANGLKFNLDAEGFDTAVAPDGETALDLLATDGFTVVVLDVMLPDIDGFTVARQMRERGDFTPVLMLTALGRPEDVMKGFDAGADDHLEKPFDLGVLLARIKALLRRRKWLREEAAAPADVIEVNGRTIDLAKLELRHGERLHRLTLMEAKLLRYLIKNAGTPVSRKMLLEDVWQLQENTDTRAIDNFIVRLRKYIEDDMERPVFVRTVRGVGYRFDLTEHESGD